MDHVTSASAPVNPPVRLANPRRTTLSSVRSYEEQAQATAHPEQRQAS